MERRKDSKGRVLKEGESQRKDGRYQYRWVDGLGTRHTIYANDLKTLRSKKEEIQNAARCGIRTLTSDMTVMELICKFAEVHKLSIRVTTLKNVYSFITALKNYPFGRVDISSVTMGDGKMFIRELYEDDYAYGTIRNFKSYLRQAFELACDDRLIEKNPFSFPLSKVIKKEEKEKVLITEAQFDTLIDFCRKDGWLTHHLDEVIILHETGLRVSEFCGLTMDDVDFEQNVIRVDHQLIYLNKKLLVLPPKTKKSVRRIPMSAEARKTFEHMIRMRLSLDEEPVVDGYSGFLQVSPNGKPRITANVEMNIRKIIKKYNKAHPQDPLPFITPHSLRHMFCTRMVQSGMNLKAVQYIMGHEKIEMTLDIYSHVNEGEAIQEFMRCTSL